MNKYSQKNMKKFFPKVERIYSSYYKGNKPLSFIIVSDIHYHPNVDKELFKILVCYIKETKPDFVLMPGDQIETIDFIDNIEEREAFESIIKSIAKIAPLIMVPGNHESANFKVNNFRSKNYSFNAKAIKYFETLNRFNNVYFLNNVQKKIKGITFLGFNPRIETYLKKYDKLINNMFIEDYLKSGLKMIENDYNVLITHNPVLLKNNMVQNAIEDFKITDLVVSGHLHDGYLPKTLDRCFEKTNIGLFFTPKIAPYPGIWCRGVHTFGRGYIFISQGFRKWTADLKIFNFFEKFTANDVERLIIENSKVLGNHQKSKKEEKN